MLYGLLLEDGSVFETLVHSTRYSLEGAATISTVDSKWYCVQKTRFRENCKTLRSYVPLSRHAIFV